MENKKGVLFTIICLNAIEGAFNENRKMEELKLKNCFCVVWERGHKRPQSVELIHTNLNSYKIRYGNPQIYLFKPKI